MEENIFKKASYEIFENSISIYLGINERENDFDVIRIIRKKEKNINSLEEYMNENKKDSNYDYRILIALNIFYEDYINNFDGSLNKDALVDKISRKLMELKNKFVINNAMIKHISQFTYDNYGLSIEECLIEEDEFARIIYDGYIMTNEDLIKYIINYLEKYNIDLIEENSLTSDESQLCRRF